jgi:hypothetical protein
MSLKFHSAISKDPVPYETSLSSPETDVGKNTEIKKMLVLALTVFKGPFINFKLSCVKKGTKLRGHSPGENYTDRATASYRRSWCHLLLIECVA